MKAEYVTAELEIITFEAQDIVTASAQAPDDGNDGGDGTFGGGYDPGLWT